MAVLSIKPALTCGFIYANGFLDLVIKKCLRRRILIVTPAASREEVQYHTRTLSLENHGQPGRLLPATPCSGQCHPWHLRPGRPPSHAWRTPTAVP